MKILLVVTKKYKFQRKIHQLFHIQIIYFKSLATTETRAKGKNIESLNKIGERLLQNTISISPRSFCTNNKWNMPPESVEFSLVKETKTTIIFNESIENVEVVGKCTQTSFFSSDCDENDSKQPESNSHVLFDDSKKEKVHKKEKNDSHSNEVNANFR